MVDLNTDFEETSAPAKVKRHPGVSEVLKLLRRSEKKRANQADISTDMYELSFKLYRIEDHLDPAQAQRAFTLAMDYATGIHPNDVSKQAEKMHNIIDAWPKTFVASPHYQPTLEFIDKVAATLRFGDEEDGDFGVELYSLKDKTAAHLSDLCTTVAKAAGKEVSGTYFRAWPGYVVRFDTPESPPTMVLLNCALTVKQVDQLHAHAHIERTPAPAPSPAPTPARAPMAP